MVTHMKRTPLTRRTPLARGTTSLKRSPIARVGKKQRSDRAELAKARGVVETRSGGRCEFELARVRCEAAAVHLHHVHRRSQGGSNEPGNLRFLCAHHHGLVHANPAWSFEHGWLARGEWEATA